MMKTFLNKNYSCSKTNLGQKLFGRKRFLVKKIWLKKNSTKNILVVKKFRYEKSQGPKVWSKLGLAAKILRPWTNGITANDT